MSASDAYALFSKPGCDRRIYLRAKGVEGAAPSAMQQMLFELGNRHEERYLDELADYSEVIEGTVEERASATKEIVREASSTIYQGVLLVDYRTTSGLDVSLVGFPDFMFPGSKAYIISDAKLSRSVDPKDRPDIDAQLQFYGYLYERTFGHTPESLEVIAGDGAIHSFDYGGADAVTASIERIVQLKTAAAEPLCDVKWSNRGACEYADRCWEEAVSSQYLSVLPGLTKRAVRALREDGITTIPQLLDAHDERTLAEVRVQVGDRTQRLGKKGISAMNHARAIASSEVIVHQPLPLPAADNVVMFDLEGKPSFDGTDDYIYLWGTSVHGEDPLSYDATYAIADGDLDDRTGWFTFLERARVIFETYGEIPWLHWAAYERTHVSKYIDRYGDPDGAASQVLRSLVDLLPVLKEAVTLPVYSYSLKSIEKYVGFERSQSEIGGDWSITVWQEAIDAQNPGDRAAYLDELETYNREDLEGMTAVYEYMRTI